MIWLFLTRIRLFLHRENNHLFGLFAPKMLANRTLRAIRCAFWIKNPQKPGLFFYKLKAGFALFLSWIVVAFGQPAWAPWLTPVAACIGYALFWKKALTMPSRKLQFWSAVGWFFCVQAVQLSWMTSIEYQGFYILFVYAGLCLGLGLQFGLLTLCVNRVPHVAVAALWALFEWSRLYFLCGFSWNPTGLSLAAWAVPMQMASVVGILGLSFWVMLTNLAWLRHRKLAWGVIGAVPYLFGIGHLAYHSSNVEKSPHLSVALVQTALLPSQKVPLIGRHEEFISPYEQWSRILKLLREKKEKFDLIVLPEHAVPLPAEFNAYAIEQVRRVFGEEKISETAERVPNLFWAKTIANMFSAEVIAGFDADEGTDHFSTAYHVTSHGTQRYEKQILLPLAEYLPFSFLKELTKNYGITEFFTPGKECKVFRGKVPLSVSICYEETFSELVRSGRNKGAELLVNLTNDGWYPSSLLSKQHFDHGRLRAVENGAPLVRACNTGITAAIDSLGRVVGSIVEERRADVLVASVPTYHFPTLFTWLGNWPILLLCLLICSYNLRNYLTCWK
jgi:apolipoprotein N-acyltransferase